MTTSETSVSFPPDPGAVLAGDHGAAAQFEALRAFAVQHVDVVLGRVRFVPGRGVGVNEAGKNPQLFRVPT